MATGGHDDMQPPRDTGYAGSLPRSADKKSTGGLATDMSALTDESERLKTEIEQLQDEIQGLSARSSVRVREYVREALSSSDGDEADVLKQHYTETSCPKIRPTRTSDWLGGVGMDRSGYLDTPKTASKKLKQRRRNIDTNPLAGVFEGSAVSGPSAMREVERRESERGPSLQTSAVGAGRPTQNADLDGGKNGQKDITRRTAARKPLTLEKYDGSTPFETFLAKFRNCARYNEWTVDERAIFLRDSLTGNASQILWELSDETGDDEIIRLLRNRFGTSCQVERFRAELHGRRRRRGEPVQSVYQDIRRLMALGFPGQSGELYEILGRDAFLEALADPSLRIRVLDQQPKTLDEALTHVTRMEAYSGSATGEDNEPNRKCARVTTAPAEQENRADERIRKLEGIVREQYNEIHKLKTQAGRQPRSFEARTQGGGLGSRDNGCAGGHAAGRPGRATGTATPPQQPQWIPPQVIPPVGGGPMTAAGAVPQQQQWIPSQAVPPGYHGPMTSAGAVLQPPPWPQQLPATSTVLGEASGQTGARPGGYVMGRGDMMAPAGTPEVSDTAAYQQYAWPNGSYRRQRRSQRPLPRDVCSRCFQRGHWRAQCPEVGFRADPTEPSASFVQGVSSNPARSETYIDVTTKGRHVSCLLDTGCERSVCPLRLCRNAKIIPVRTELFAANGTRIEVVGATRVVFEIQGMPMYADVFVSEAVDEFILGYDWLVRNNCEWLFARGRIVVNGVSVQLHTRASAPSVRRIFVRETFYSS